MKVCFVDRIGAHAIWGVIAPIAEKLLANGHQVFYVRMDDGGDRGRSFIPEGVDISDIVVPLNGGLRILSQQRKFASDFSKVVAEIKPDIVHTNFAVPSIAARWVAHRAKVPVIVSTQHELYGSMRLHYQLGLRLTERFCKAVTYVSNTVAESFGRSAEVSRDSQTRSNVRHVVIANGVNVSRIQDVVKDVNYRVPGRIVCAGRMVPVKGHEVLIRAFAEARKQHSHLHLHLIGTGPLEDEFKELVDQLGLTEYVHFLGWRSHDEVLREMAEAELVVSASHQEGFGLVIAEALVCKTPILLSDIPVFSEVMRGYEQFGRFFQTGDVDSLTSELVSFFSKEKVPIETASKQELHSLSSDAMAEQYLALYKELEKHFSYKSEGA